MEHYDLDDPHYKAGFVAVAGRPNVGKSTLINTLLKQKIAAVTPRPQTTRKQQYGILTLEGAQIIFVDTPGIHVTKHKLGEYMNEEAAEAFDEVDLLLVLVDGSQLPNEDDRLLAEFVLRLKSSVPIIMGVNMIDKIDKAQLQTNRGIFEQLYPGIMSVSISATRGDNLSHLLDLLIERLPEHPPFFPPEQITDSYEREIAADLIREAALLYLRDEVPHSLAVRIDEFNERGKKGAYIAATLFAERDSQKGIVIGRGGKMIKRIGSHARKQIELMSGRKVYLELRVKVRKNWRNDENMLRLFGFRSRN